jgi:phosphotransferase system enzyme I (PtsI)
LKIQRDLLVQVFEDMDDPYLRTRKDDVEHVVRRVQRILVTDDPAYLNDPDYSELTRQPVGRADHRRRRFDPGRHHPDAASGCAGFVTEYGGPLSHTAILARSLGIPAVVGCAQRPRLSG